MEIDRWRRVEEIYQEALDLPESDRAAFIDRSCGSDVELKRQTLAILASDAKAGDFLESPALQDAARVLVRAQSENGESARKSTVRHYRILEKLGVGGMGVVYKAQDLRLGRYVALKFLPESAAYDGQMRERFEREAQLASALDHPHICTIYEIGEDEGHVFIAMQFLEGETLKRRIQRKALSRDEVYEYGIQIADALDAAHAKGIIHRDIKPANIFLANAAGGRGAAVKVLDFGIAKLHGSDDAGDSSTAAAPSDAAESLTRTGMTMGTTAYMSPEQARSESLDFRTDLFSFGAVLHEMATGRQAFSGETNALIQEAVLQRDPPPASSVNPKLPAAFDAIVAKALEKDRELRCQSAAELRADLKRLRRDATSGAMPAATAAPFAPSGGVAVSAPSPASRRRLWPWAAAVLAAAALAIGWYVSKPVTPTPHITERQLTASFAAPVLDAAISPDGVLVAYGDDRGLHLKIVDTGEVYDLPSPAGLKIYRISWFPNSRNLLFSAMPGPALRTQLWAVSVYGGAARLIRDDVRDAAISPDGASIAFTTNAQDSLWVMGTTGEQARQLASIGPEYSLGDPAWYPGTHTIVYRNIGRSPGEIRFRSMARGSGKSFFRSFDIDTGKPGSSWAPDGEFGEFAALRDGSLIYLATERGIEGIYQLADARKSGAQRPRLLRQWDGVFPYRLTASSDGKRLAALRMVTELGIFLARLTDGGKRLDEIRRLKTSGRENAFHAWTPDGRAVVFESNRDEAYHIFAQALDRPDEERLIVSQPASTAGRYSPDGKWLFYVANERTDPHLMRMPASGGPPQLVLHDARFHNYFCTSMPANFCAVAFGDANQMVVRRLDPTREPPAGGFSAADLSELAHTDYGPTDWGISPDGSSLAMVRPDPEEARIHIISLNGAPSEDVMVKGWTALQTLNWAQGGKGWYVASRMVTNGFVRTPAPFAYVDRAGNATMLNAPESFMPSWGVPSPDGKHLAFASAPGAANVWLMERF